MIANKRQFIRHPEDLLILFVLMQGPRQGGYGDAHIRGIKLRCSCFRLFKFGGEEEENTTGPESGNLLSITLNRRGGEIRLKALMSYSLYSTCICY